MPSQQRLMSRTMIFLLQNLFYLARDVIKSFPGMIWQAFLHTKRCQRIFCEDDIGKANGTAIRMSIADVNNNLIIGSARDKMSAFAIAAIATAFARMRKF